MDIGVSVQAWTQGSGPVLTAVVIAVATLLVSAILPHLRAVLGGRRLAPGPWFSIPVLGDAPFVFTDPVRFLYKRFRQYGSIFRLCLLGIDVNVVTDWAVLRQLLSRSEGSSMEVPFPAFELLMEDLANMQDDRVHKYWRKLLLQDLAPAGLEAKFSTALDLAQQHVSRWCKTRSFDLMDEANSLSMAWGSEVMGLPRLLPSPQRLEWVSKQLLTFCDGLYGLPFNLPGSRLRAALNAKKELIKGLKDDLAPMLGSVKELAETAGPLPQRPPQAVLDALHARQEVTHGPGPDPAAAVLTSKSTTLLHLELAGSAMRMDVDHHEAVLALLHTVVAAVDTTRAALPPVLALLGLQGGMQESLREEQREAIANHGPELTYRAVNTAMPLLEACVKESLRLIPAAGGGFRKLTSPLTVSGHTLPAGAYVWYIPSLMHALDPVVAGCKDGAAACEVNARGVPRHMDVCDLQYSFKPERWLSDDTRPRQYLTFGSGLHACMGQQLLYMEMKVMLALLLRAATWSVPAGTNIFRTAETALPFVPKKGQGIVLVHPTPL